MIEMHPEMMRLVMARLALQGAGLAAAAALDAGPLAWPIEPGLLLLTRWEGERYPIPSLEMHAQRRATIVGAALGDATTITEWSGVGHTPGTMYHYAVVPVSGGGLIGPVNPVAVQTRVFDAGGAVVGLLPNPPTGVTARPIAGRRVLITWTYTRAGEQAPPLHMAVFRTLNGAAFDFNTMLGYVSYQSGRTHYAYIDGPLSPGDVACYTVRASGTAGLSLIPRLRGGPSPDYNAVALDRVPCVTIPTGPPQAVANLSGETH